MIGSGTGEASQGWTKNDDGRRKARLKNSGVEDSPC